MTKCNQCGKMNAAGAVYCQSCGAPLSNMVDNGMSQLAQPPQRSISPDQPELPAWLESLRAGERSAAPTNAAANFSAADFIDENALPSWMQAERNDLRDNTGANLALSPRPSALPVLLQMETECHQRVFRHNHCLMSSRCLHGCEQQPVVRVSQQQHQGEKKLLLQVWYSQIICRSGCGHYKKTSHHCQAIQ